MSDMINQPNAPKLTGWHVLLIAFAFFGIMFAVNGVFLFNAIKSFPGEQVEKSYLQGLEYNDTIAERKAQSELGWRAEIGLIDQQVVLRLFDQDNAPVNAPDVTGILRAPATNAYDQLLNFSSNTAGEYRSDRLVLDPGRWGVEITARDTQSEPLFQAFRTVNCCE